MKISIELPLQNFQEKKKLRMVQLSLLLLFGFGERNGPKFLSEGIVSSRYSSKQ